MREENTFLGCFMDVSKTPVTATGRLELQPHLLPPVG